MGPHTFNFVQAAELAVAAGAAFAVPDLQRALEKVLALLQCEPDLQAAGRAAGDFSQTHRGAAARTAHAVKKLLASFTAPTGR
jgi:3-deoxy-D-manno-octulosonic-acid transferase